MNPKTENRKLTRFAEASARQVTGDRIRNWFSSIIYWNAFVLPIISLSCLLFLLSLNVTFWQQTQQQKVYLPPLSSVHIADYPFLKQKIIPDISANAAIVMDDSSKVVLYAKNTHLHFSPASTTKIMSSLVGLSYYQLNDLLTIKTATVEGSVVGFVPGQKLAFHDLLYAMMLPSANDAALAIAQNYPGGINAFVQKMNENAHSWHLDNTHFVDPIGLEDDNDYTTVVELARLASVAIQNPILNTIVSQKTAVISSADKKQLFLLKSLNQLLGYDGVDGIKTGYTAGAKEVLVTSLTKNKHKIIIVVMMSEDRFGDTKKLIDTIIPNVEYIRINNQIIK